MSAYTFSRCPFCERMRCRSAVCAEALRIEDEIDAALIRERGGDERISEGEMLSRLGLTSEEFWNEVEKS